MSWLVMQLIRRTDMVGKVKNVQELIKIKKNDVEKSLFKFEISNGRYLFLIHCIVVTCCFVNCDLTIISKN